MSNVDDFIDERLRMPGAGRGRDMGLDLRYDTGKPLQTGDGRPRTYTIPVSQEVAGARDADHAFSGAPLSGSWSPATSVPISATGLVMGGLGTLRGFSFRETTGTDRAVVRVRGGLDVYGPLVATVSLAPGESVRDFFGESGIRTNGLFCEVLSGLIEGAIYFQGTL